MVLKDFLVYIERYFFGKTTLEIDIIYLKALTFFFIMSF